MILKNKKIIILGASGFIGRSLATYFSKKRYNVVGTYHNNKISINGIKLLKCLLNT